MTKKDDKIKAILDFILFENPSTQDQIAEELNISRRYVTQLLKPLIDQGVIKRSYMVDFKKYEDYIEDSYLDNDFVGNALIMDLLKNMLKHVLNQLETSFNALLNFDQELANVALEMDYSTNNMVETIRNSVDVIVNTNYNYVFSKSVLYTEIAYNLERIGDYCGHIAKFVVNEDLEVQEKLIKLLKKMFKLTNKMVYFSMIAFIEKKLDLKEDIMVMEDKLHELQSKSVNLIAVEMAEINLNKKELSNHFMYLFRVVKSFERIGDISIEIVDAAIEFHKNIPRPITPRSFR